MGLRASGLEEKLERFSFLLVPSSLPPAAAAACLSSPSELLEECDRFWTGLERLWGDSELRLSLENCRATLADGAPPPLFPGWPLSGEESEPEWGDLAVLAPNSLPLGESGEELRLFLGCCGGGGDWLRSISLRRDLGDGGDWRETLWGGGEASDRRRPLKGGDRERRPPFLSMKAPGESPLLRRGGGGDFRFLSSGEVLLLRRSLGGGEGRRRRSPGGGGEEAEVVRLRRPSGEGERCLATGFLNGGGDSEPEEDDPEDDLAAACGLFGAGFASGGPFNFPARFGDGESDPEEELPALGDDTGSILRGRAGEAELESRRDRLIGEATLRRGGGEGLRRGGEAEDAVLRRLMGGDMLAGDRDRRLNGNQSIEEKKRKLTYS